MTSPETRELDSGDVILKLTLSIFSIAGVMTTTEFVDIGAPEVDAAPSVDT